MNGFHHIPGFFNLSQQREILEEARAIARVSPLFTPVMPGSGSKFNYQMTNCGESTTAHCTRRVQCGL